RRSTAHSLRLGDRYDCAQAEVVTSERLPLSCNLALAVEGTGANSPSSIRRKPNNSRRASGFCHSAEQDRPVAIARRCCPSSANAEQKSVHSAPTIWTQPDSWYQGPAWLAGCHLLPREPLYELRCSRTWSGCRSANPEKTQAGRQRGS